MKLRTITIFDINISTIYRSNNFVSSITGVEKYLSYNVCFYI